LQHGNVKHRHPGAKAEQTPARICDHRRGRGAPMRGCRISIMLENTTGNTASRPLMAGPTQPDSVTTVATSVATKDARSGMSYKRRVIRGILT